MCTAFMYCLGVLLYGCHRAAASCSSLKGWCAHGGPSCSRYLTAPHSDLMPLTFAPLSTHPPTAPQDALAHGQPVDGIPLHTCACPPCFTAVEKGGSVTCVPKCDLQYCDLDVGVCHAAPGTGARKRGRDVEG